MSRWTKFLLDIVAIIKRWFFARGVKKGAAAGAAQQKADDAAKVSKRIEREETENIEHRLKTISELQEERAEWRRRHGF